MNICPHCGSAFECRADVSPAEPCWCAQLPMLSPDAYVVENDNAKAGSCFCPACLRALLEKTNVTSQ